MFRGLTQTGANYLATRLANALPVEFVKIKIGNGSIPSETNPYNSQSLISYMQDAKILSKRQEENAISITVQVTNENREQGFYLKEIGVFVNDNGIEKLYWYCNEDNAQYVPAKTDSGIAFEIEIKMEVTNQESTILNWSGEGTWINKTYLENTLLNYTEKGTFTGTAKDLEDRITGLAGRKNGKFPLSSAIKGNVYLLEQTQKFYVCTQNYSGTTISVPNSSFTELSVYENMNRLENFFKFKVINSDVIALKTVFEASFRIEECKFVIVNIDTYSNSENLLNLSSLTIPYLFLKQGGKYYFSDFSTAYEKAEISLIGNNLIVKSVNKTVIYIGEIYTI